MAEHSGDPVENKFDKKLAAMTGKLVKMKVSFNQVAERSSDPEEKNGRDEKFVAMRG